MHLYLQRVSPHNLCYLSGSYLLLSSPQMQNLFFFLIVYSFYSFAFLGSFLSCLTELCGVCLLWDQNLVPFLRCTLWVVGPLPQGGDLVLLYSLSLFQEKVNNNMGTFKVQVLPPAVFSSSLAWHFLILKEMQHKRIPFYYITGDTIEQIIFNMSREMGPLLSGQSSKPACNLLFKFIWGKRHQLPLPRS